MTPQDRMKAWKDMPEPKPSWESFKRQLARGMTVEKMTWLCQKQAKK